MAQLSDIRVTFNRSLSAEVQQTQSRVLQVWYEPLREALPMPIMTIDGDLKYSAQSIAWSSRHVAAVLIRQIARTVLARILVRVHCAYLLDQKGRPVSSSPEVIVPTGLPPMPGGVFESWFWIQGG